MKCNSRNSICAYTDYIKTNLINGAITTLVGEKISNLIIFSKKHIKNNDTFIGELEKIISYFKTAYRILWENESSYYVFIYQEELIQDRLSDVIIKTILRKFDYDIFSDGPKSYLDTMQNRFQRYQESNAEFPHEMGIFLGYPHDDVEGFIEHGGMNYLYCGYWKVYCNLEQAKRTFAIYDSVRMEAMQMIARGCPIESLNELK